MHMAPVPRTSFAIAVGFVVRPIFKYRCLEERAFGVFLGFALSKNSLRAKGIRQGYEDHDFG